MTRPTVSDTRGVLPRFEIVHRARPVDLVRPGSDLARPVAPYVAVTADVAGPEPVSLTLGSGDVELTVVLDDNGLALRIATGATTTTHRSRRSGKPEADVDAVALSLTATHVVGYTREDGRWRVRARFDLHERFDPHDESWLSGLEATSSGPVAEVAAGAFGQLGLRDLRLVTEADGTPYREGTTYLLTATSAGPGAFATGHASVWGFDPDSLELDHRADLYFRRPHVPGVYGDHACHLLRDGDRWLVAASTWGDFDKARDHHEVTVTLAESTADLTRGTHVLETRPLALPTTGLPSVGVWDPHLVRTDDGWLVGYVSARKYFRFHPVLAEGPDLDSLRLRAAATGRRATEGTTLARLDGEWRLLASDGRDGRRRQNARFPIFDLDLREIGTVDAPYPSNIPWPTLLQHDGGWLMIAFNGARYGGRLVGYGSHGDVVVARSILPAEKAVHGNWTSPPP
jgi:hypothetical protein